MLRVQRSRVQETHEEKQAGTEKDEIAVTPLAIPMLAGPGAISTTILLQNEAQNRRTAPGAVWLHCGGGDAGELSSSCWGARCALAEPDCHEHRHPHHGIIAGGSRGPVHAQRHQGVPAGFNFAAADVILEECVASGDGWFFRRVQSPAERGIFRHAAPPHEPRDFASCSPSE
jgi:hypothetical protein